MRPRYASAFVFALALLPLSAMASPPGPPTRIVGQYFLSDDDLNLAGGAVLYSDCSHDGSVIGAGIPAGPPGVPPIVAKLTPTYWVNDPDPKLSPYDQWLVPEALEGMPRLFLCYDFQRIDGGPPLPFSEFCDWAPRDLRQPLEVDLDTDGTRDLLISTIYRGGRRLCAEP